jgi:hypothetical protein
MHKIVKLPTLPEAVGFIVVIVAWSYVWNHFVPASVKTTLS